MASTDSREYNQIVGELKNNDEVLALLRQILSRFNDMDGKYAALEAQFNLHVESAFPSGDSKAHREYHQRLIDTMHAQEALYADLRVTLIKRGVVGAFYVIVVLAVLGLASGISLVLHKGVMATVMEWLLK